MILRNLLIIFKNDFYITKIVIIENNDKISTHI
jgi:hypothetical protein